MLQSVLYMYVSKLMGPVSCIVERSLWDGSTPEGGSTRPALAPREQLPQGVGLWVLPHPQ